MERAIVAALCTHCRPVIQHCRHAVCAESYVAVALCKHYRRSHGVSLCGVCVLNRCPPVNLPD